MCPSCRMVDSQLPTVITASNVPVEEPAQNNTRANAVEYVSQDRNA